MRILLITLFLFLLAGCETLATAIDEKELSVRIHDTRNLRQGFGYYERYNYIGYSITGTFGKTKKKPIDFTRN